MGDTTKIEWPDHTFNGWIGCSKVHTGCKNCYAEADFADRKKRVVWGENGTRIVTTEEYWKKPMKWNREVECKFCKEGCPRPRVFCASLADVFEDWRGEVFCGTGEAHFTGDADPTRVVTNKQMVGCDSEGYHYTTLDDCRARLFRLIDDTPNLDWLLLTKRPENIRRMWPDARRRANVWLGTSVSDQATANLMIPRLLQCRGLAPVLFASAEPLLGPIDFRNLWDDSRNVLVNAISGETLEDDGNDSMQIIRNDSPIGWVIVGGESGANARPNRPEWTRSIVRQCREGNIPCFHKQMGANVVDRNDSFGYEPNDFDFDGDFEVEHHIHGFLENYQGADCRIKLRDKKGGDPAEWPEDLRVRQFPKAGAPCA